VALSALFGAAIVGLLSSSRTFLQLSLNFLAGGLYGADWSELNAALPWFVPATLLAVVAARRLNVLALGDEIAAGLGVAPASTRLVVLGLTGILTGAAVSISGMASFVGLVSPHLARFAVGHDARRLVPASALVGALLVTAADLLARLVIRPAEIPMGIITAALGAPFLLYLLRVHR
jgi:iron complex transport system permease protein